ncbi:MAG: SMC-Scp complex subunit ScpB [Clostridiales bacterium]|nr:SMC-Scp complex subunit ScpB [Clostridiales bacterium]
MKKLAKLTNIIESILFVSGTQVAIKDIAEKLEVSDKDIMGAVAELNKKYNEESGVQILVFNKKLQFCSNPEYADQVSSVLNPIRERELSRSMLEVAAIIAYRQPVTRIDLEELRGANSEYAIQKLLELGVIEPVGRKDAVGRPVMFGTTDKFLKRFQISSLDDLPRYEELMTQIQSLHANDEQDDYLYKKDEYVENEGDNDAISSEENGDLVNDEVAVTSNSNSLVNEDSNEDFDLPDIEDEELPEFLAGEEVEKF